MIVVQHAFEHEQTVENLSACLNSRKNATGDCAGVKASIENVPRSASIEMSPFVIDEDPGVAFASAPFPLSQ